MRLFVVTCIAISLMFAEHTLDNFAVFRTKLSLVVYPLQKIVDLPLSSYSAVYDYFVSHKTLAQDNNRLQKQQLLLNGKLQKLQELEVENARLRQLLNSTVSASEDLAVASIIKIDPDPFSQQIMLDKGSNQGVVAGQPIVDAKGIMGSVIEVNLLTSRVMLLTDVSHAVPVENMRNGVRAIAIGKGEISQLELKHVTNTADIVVGDVFVTSGLDGRYPAGYPVGTVLDVAHDPSKPFALIHMTPTAELDKGRQVLLVKIKATQ